MLPRPRARPRVLLAHLSWRVPATSRSTRYSASSPVRAPERVVRGRTGPVRPAGAIRSARRGLSAISPLLVAGGAQRILPGALLVLRAGSWSRRSWRRMGSCLFAMRSRGDRRAGGGGRGGAPRGAGGPAGARPRADPETPPASIPERLAVLVAAQDPDPQAIAFARTYVFAARSAGGGQSSCPRARRWLDGWLAAPRRSPAEAQAAVVDGIRFAQRLHRALGIDQPGDPA